MATFFDKIESLIDVVLFLIDLQFIVQNDIQSTLTSFYFSRIDRRFDLFTLRIERDLGTGRRGCINV